MAAKASTVSTSNVLSANTEIEISKKSIETNSSQKKLSIQLEEKISRPLEENQKNMARPMTEKISRQLEENQKNMSRPLEENLSKPLEEKISRPLEESRPICVVTVLGLALQPGGVASNQVIVIL